MELSITSKLAAPWPIVRLSLADLLYLLPPSVAVVNEGRGTAAVIDWLVDKVGIEIE
jgi:hypothetical protein